MMKGKHILGYDESEYGGGYEYSYDPKHKEKPAGPGWYATDHGWARGSDGDKHTPSKIPNATHAIKHDNAGPFYVKLRTRKSQMQLMQSNPPKH